ncbi:MAG: DNA end-binding protein Ku [Planctomycetota bacterium]
MNQLHKDCNSRVKYQKVCPEHGELKSDGIVSGYEHQKDQYVVVEPDDLNKLRTNSERSVGIDGFIPVDAIDSRFYAGKAHYLMPDGIAGERPYQLLRDGMQKNEVCAIAQVVMSGREQLVVVRAIDRMLVMFGLHYPAKVRKIEDYQDGIEEIEFKPEEIALTDTLIGASKIAEFDFSTYTDTYVQKLKKLIEMKVAGEEIVQAPDHEEPKILNLMDALKKSVAEAQTKQAVGADADPDTAAGDDDSAATDSASAKKLAPSAGKKKRSKKAQGE